EEPENTQEDNDNSQESSDHQQSELSMDENEENSESQEAESPENEPPALPHTPPVSAADPNYKVFTTKFDEEVLAEDLASSNELERLRAYLDQQLEPLKGAVSRLANKLQRRLQAQQNRSWSFDMEEGLLDAGRLARIISNPTTPLSFKVEKDTDFRDTVVTILLDNSGSMRGRPISIATAFTSKMVHRSFFLTQLERRGVHLSEGPHNYLLAKYKVISIMREIETITKINKKYLWRLVDQGQYLDAGANLETAMPMFQNGTIEYLPILSIGSEKHSTELVGALYYIDALKTFNKALFDTSKEEHS
ncbi:hypothetical protein N9311_05495, partial [Amylibacter sp.]|nr:hypothetical protein [Amylibacter sp.]